MSTQRTTVRASPIRTAAWRVTPAPGHRHSVSGQEFSELDACDCGHMCWALRQQCCQCDRGGGFVWCVICKERAREGGDAP